MEVNKNIRTYYLIAISCLVFAVIAFGITFGIYYNQIEPKISNYNNSDVPDFVKNVKLS
jgi:hypothetical protein